MKEEVKLAFAEPDDDLRIVSMLEFQGSVFVATQKGVYRLEGDTFERLQLVDKTPMRADKL